jgi:hypothetical protein
MDVLSTEILRKESELDAGRHLRLRVADCGLGIDLHSVKAHVRGGQDLCWVDAGVGDEV